MKAAVNKIANFMLFHSSNSIGTFTKTNILLPFLLGIRISDFANNASGELLADTSTNKLSMVLERHLPVERKTDGLVWDFVFLQFSTQNQHAIIMSLAGNSGRIPVSS
jgi:hypothetical protein